jgi:hypothetical protein
MQTCIVVNLHRALLLHHRGASRLISCDPTMKMRHLMSFALNGLGGVVAEASPVRPQRVVMLGERRCAASRAAGTGSDLEMLGVDVLVGTPQ